MLLARSHIGTYVPYQERGILNSLLVIDGFCVKRKNIYIYIYYHFFPQEVIMLPRKHFIVGGRQNIIIGLNELLDDSNVDKF